MQIATPNTGLSRVGCRAGSTLMRLAPCLQKCRTDRGHRARACLVRSTRKEADRQRTWHAVFKLNRLVSLGSAPRRPRQAFLRV